MAAKDFIKLRNSIKNSKVLKQDSQSNGYNRILKQYIPLKKMDNLKITTSRR
tara:strand:- start:852 stop:1007 length:156 start_codon:yes stop_codon:yes gene_type:complete